MYFFYGDVLFTENTSMLDAPVEHILPTKHAKKGFTEMFRVRTCSSFTIK